MCEQTLQFKGTPNTERKGKSRNRGMVRGGTKEGRSSLWGEGKRLRLEELKLGFKG